MFGSDPQKNARPRPIIFGCGGTRLSAAERALFRDADPFGFILFKRNCETPDQLGYLIAELKQVTERADIAIAIDQEGGRVSRLQAPKWPQYPAARAFGLMYEQDPSWGLDAIKAYGRIVAYELSRLGFNVNCAPVIDLFNPNGTPAIGDRAYSSDPAVISALAQALAETFLANGILPVIKHFPGHGRLMVDPHATLPRIDAPLEKLEAKDFAPFVALKHLPIGMNSHAVFAALDPENPASLSAKVNVDIVRGKLGFDGLLFSDDISMKALKGPPGALARRALEAGNDIVLHCNADASEMAAIGLALEPMSETAFTRWTRAKSMVAPMNPSYTPTEDAAKLDVWLGGLAMTEGLT